MGDQIRTESMRALLVLLGLSLLVWVGLAFLYWWLT